MCIVLLLSVKQCPFTTNELKIPHIEISITFCFLYLHVFFHYTALVIAIHLLTFYNNIHFAQFLFDCFSLEKPAHYLNYFSFHRFFLLHIE